MKKVVLVLLILGFAQVQGLSVKLPYILILTGELFSSEEITEVQDILEVIGIPYKLSDLEELEMDSFDLVYVPHTDDADLMISKLKNSQGFLVIHKVLDKNGGVMLVGGSGELSKVLEEERTPKRIDYQGEVKFNGLKYGRPFEEGGREILVEEDYLWKNKTDRFMSLMTAIYYAIYHVEYRYLINISTKLGASRTVGSDATCYVFNMAQRAVEIPIVYVIDSNWANVELVEKLDLNADMPGGSGLHRDDRTSLEFESFEKETKEGKVIVVLSSYTLSEVGDPDLLHRREFNLSYLYVLPKTQEEERSFLFGVVAVVVLIAFLLIYTFLKRKRLDLTLEEERVYNYIKGKGGKIELMEASKDLEIEKKKLKELIDGISRKGYLE